MYSFVRSLSLRLVPIFAPYCIHYVHERQSAELNYSKLWISYFWLTVSNRSIHFSTSSTKIPNSFYIQPLIRFAKWLSPFWMFVVNFWVYVWFLSFINHNAYSLLHTYKHKHSRNNGFIPNNKKMFAKHLSQLESSC